MTVKAVVLHTDSTWDPIYLDDNELRQLQQAVGGYIQAVSPDSITTLWCNEEGKVKSPPLPRNDLATRLWHVLDPRAVGEWMAGDVVVTGGVDEDGDTQSITDETAALILELLP